MNKGMLAIMIMLGIVIIALMLFQAFGKKGTKYIPKYYNSDLSRAGVMGGINYPESTVPLRIGEIYQANSWR